MKIAAKFCVTALTALFGLGIASNSFALEEGPITSSIPGPASSTEAPSVSAPSIDAGVSLNDEGEETKGKAESKKEPRKKGDIPDSVKGVIDRLNSTTDDVSLEDLNEAREAVVKLDVLIDIEKRLTDLSKIRQERAPKVPAALAAAIPASALGVPAENKASSKHSPTPAPSENFFSSPGASSDAFLSSMEGMSPDQKVAFSSAMAQAKGKASLDVLQIWGATGDYSAKIKEGSGKEKTYREGDKLSDGSKIVSISRNGVTLLMKNNKRETFRVKNVTKVFSGG